MLLTVCILVVLNAAFIYVMLFLTRNNKVLEFRKRLIDQSQLIDNQLLPYVLLPSYLKMTLQVWKPLKSYLPKGYDMESVEALCREAEGKDRIKAYLEKHPQ